MIFLEQQTSFNSKSGTMLDQRSVAVCWRKLRTIPSKKHRLWLLISAKWSTNLSLDSMINPRKSQTWFVRPYPGVTPKTSPSFMAGWCGPFSSSSNSRSDRWWDDPHESTFIIIYSSYSSFLHIFAWSWHIIIFLLLLSSNDKYLDQHTPWFFHTKYPLVMDKNYWTWP